MKRITSTFIAVLLSMFTFLSAQVQEVKLEQMAGKFTTETLTLSPGEYQFNISNNEVGHDVGFVLVPKGQYDQSKHIKEAYVKAPVKSGANGMTGVVNLAPGEYEYFCPLNPTPKYTLMVKETAGTIKLGQVPGKFNVQALTVAEGTYQFEIANSGVDHEVGFVLVPKGQYEMSDHIKAAYVTETVKTGASSLTGLVDLEAGEYEYFCPMNPTPKYTLTVVK